MALLTPETSSQRRVVRALPQLQGQQKECVAERRVHGKGGEVRAGELTGAKQLEG
jgi:hypothetical protein